MTTEPSLPCFIYASRRKAETYVWLRERDAFAELPPALLEQLGDLRFVLEVELHPERRLPHENATRILERLHAQGWYLQLPPGQDGDAM